MTLYKKDPAVAAK